MSSFGKNADGEAVQQVEIKAADGSISANIITQGAAIQDLRVKTPEGLRSVVIGFDTIDGYVANTRWHHGAIAGRFANRIANGRFTLDGKEYQIPINEPATGQTCHGGVKGFGWRNWKVEKQSESSLTLRLDSEDGEQGFPGNLTALVTYTLTSNTLSIEYSATADKTSPVNLTNHAYFNLDGTRGGNATVHEQKLRIDADRYTPVNDKLIPTGDLAPVEGTPLDFRTAKPLRYESNGELFHFDHNFCLNQMEGLHFAAELESSNGDLKMSCWTDQPGIQVFDGMPLDLIKDAGLGGFKIGSRAGVCLETQIYPDSLNQPSFPQSVIKPGESYRHHTEYRFQ